MGSDPWWVTGILYWSHGCDTI